MSLEERFQASDSYLEHLDAILNDVTDPMLCMRYAGFLSVTAVTVFELSFKEIIYKFADRKHRVFGNHIRSTYERLNGKISINDITNSHIKKFCDIYLRRFKKELDSIERKSLSIGGGSVRSSYGNIITWRNKFVYEGQMPPTATYEEAIKSYLLGKNVLVCLEYSLRR
ncbi:hypothetical protein B3286c2_0589 [Brucella vulpis]|uniref:HEPN domain-containing protein n=1 Tax=Brucella vulpis TaxID=981386 RepID=UPI00073A7CA6|nr:hypothetical protein BF3285c2_0594 [Brucella vulpis]CUW51605.1 hypothetical protein B3286c2_0589 [Brucella vulpis]